MAPLAFALAIGAAPIDGCAFALAWTVFLSSSICLCNAFSRPDVSFDAPVRSDESDGMTFGDRMVAPGISSEATVGANELREVFLETIASFAEGLEERDRQILDERILAEEPRTLADLGEEFDVSRERVRQLEAKLVKRLRTYMEENLVDFEYYNPGGSS